MTRPGTRRCAFFVSRNGAIGIPSCAKSKHASCVGRLRRNESCSSSGSGGDEPIADLARANRRVRRRARDKVQGDGSHLLEVTPIVTAGGGRQVALKGDSHRRKLHREPVASLEPVFVRRIAAKELTLGPVKR